MDKNILKSKLMNIARESNSNDIKKHDDDIKNNNYENIDVSGDSDLSGTSLQDDLVSRESLYSLSNLSASELTNRISDEYAAHYFYVNAANWCNDNNYKKAAAFFEAEAVTELKHAKGLEDYMVGFNVIPRILKVETNKTFVGLCQIIREAYRLELDLMVKYNDTSSKIFPTDLTTFDFLQKYRKIQRNSVVEYNDLINAINLIDENNKFEVLYFEQTFFE